MDSLGLFNQEKRKRKRKKEKKKKYTAPREEVLYEEQAGIIGVRVESCMRKKRETKLSYSSLKKKSAHTRLESRHLVLVTNTCVMQEMLDLLGELIKL